ISKAGVALNGSLIFGALGAGAALLLLIWLMRQRASAKSARRDVEIADEPAAEVSAPSPAPVSEPATFVSYAHANSETVWPLTSQLEADGVAIWIDRDDLKAGQGWAGTIVRAIKQSGRFCLMCSAESFASDHVRREIYLADKYGKPMLPVRLDDAEMPEDIEYFLIDRQWVDLAGMDMDGQMRALKALFQT
ncbi:MAG: toll/interleukin-1 receptor domain-containing protein, partial [Hyphomonadaceae bacterium]